MKEEHVTGCLNVGENLYRIVNKVIGSKDGGTNLSIVDKATARELEENFAVLKHIRTDRQEIDANLRNMMEKIENEVIEEAKQPKKKTQL